MQRYCGAKTRSGSPCKKAPLQGRSRCKLHGGASLAGIAHPNFKGGKYSKALPTRLLEKYHAALNDPDLLSSKNEIAILDARLAELLQRLDDGPGAGLWLDCSQQADGLFAAVAVGDLGQVEAIATRIKEICRLGQEQDRAWQEVHKTADLRRKLADSEVRRLEAAEHSITAPQVLSLSQSLLESVRRNVSDRATLAAIAADFQQLLNRQQTLSA